MNAPFTTTGSGAATIVPPDSRPAPVLLTDWRKVCACGRAHSWHRWCRLDRVGPQVHEYRNCACGSTLVVDLLQIVDIVRPERGT